MIPLEQRRLWRPDDHPDGPQRGDCGAACVASIFEADYEDCASIDGTTQSISEWTVARYPGVVVESRVLTDLSMEDRIGGHVDWPTSHYERGYWMATIWSSRIPDREMYGCGCGGVPECEWCHGRPEERFLGLDLGLHAVVMRHWELVWDPHPHRSPSQQLFFRSATTWRVIDPSLLRR